MDGSYGKYLPSILDEFAEFQKLNQIESAFLDEVYNWKEKFLKNQWIESADYDGLKKFSEIASLTDYFEQSEIEEFREFVFFSWNNAAPYTYEDLVDWLDGYCGADFYHINIDYDNYYIDIHLEREIKDKNEFVYEKVRAMTPANMVVEVYTIYNTYGLVGKYKNSLFISNQMTHKQIREDRFPDEDGDYTPPENEDNDDEEICNTYMLVGGQKHKLFITNKLTHRQIREEKFPETLKNNYRLVGNVKNIVIQKNELTYADVYEKDLMSYAYNSYSDLKSVEHKKIVNANLKYENVPFTNFR